MFKVLRTLWCNYWTYIIFISFMGNIGLNIIFLLLNIIIFKQILVCKQVCFEAGALVGYGRRIVFRRSWVRIPAPFTGWIFFTYQKLQCLFENTKINKKRPGLAHFYKNKYFSQKQLITSRKCTFSVTCQLHLLPGYCHKTLNTIGKFETTIEIVVFT